MSTARRLMCALAVACGAFLASASPAVAAPTTPSTVLVPDAAADSCVSGAPAFSPAAPAALTLLQAERSWKITRGGGVLVAIVDSGINAADPRLAPRMAGGVNLVHDGTDPRGYTDQLGHGTAIAGIIAAQPDSRSALVGLAPDVRLYSVRVYANTGEEADKAGFGPDVLRLAAGIRAAADSGAQIINVSMSTPFFSPEIDEAVAYAERKGALLVASGGNVEASDTEITIGDTQAEAADERYPAGSPGVLGVTATTVPGDTVTDASIHGPHIALAAPGQGVLTLGLNTGDCFFNDDPKSSWSTAYASAAAALVAAAYPRESREEWAYRLTATALRGDPDARDDQVGWGIVQPAAALALLPGPDTRGPVSPFVPRQEATTTPSPETIVIAGPSDQHERDMTRVVLIAVLSAGALGLIGVISIARNRRERESAE
ncbi:S8 family serine peptidase [Microbacterium sp. ZW T5_56]|uniref:S8 family serine peptidase n=1 Tax=Microbacterium sp. ZW T5_56 TaxID=3378081 RepID=UPI003854B058